MKGQLELSGVVTVSTEESNEGECWTWLQNDFVTCCECKLQQVTSLASLDMTSSWASSLARPRIGQLTFDPSLSVLLFLGDGSIAVAIFSVSYFRHRPRTLVLCKAKDQEDEGRDPLSKVKA